MASDKMTLEKGAFNWDEGRGYQAPSIPPSGGTPPGWFNSVEEDHMGGFIPQSEEALRPRPTTGQWPVQEQEPALPHKPGAVVAAQGTPAPETLPPEILEEALERLALPSERINLDNGTAVFMNHQLKLTKGAVLDIKRILAAEVHGKLLEEMKRVTTAVQVEEVQGDGGGGQRAGDVPEVQGSKGAMDDAAAS